MNFNDPEEWFPVVDENGNVTGKALRRTCHDGKSMLLHPVVHLHLFNTKGDLFLQKRAETKDIEPGKWDTSVGGHVGLVESIEAALLREVREELGITISPPGFLTRYIWQSSRERELINSYSTISDEIPVINKSEISEGRYWTIPEIKMNLGKNIFTPNFEHEFKLIFY
jgi:isopentenyldiphosphate isomerase